MAGGPLISVLIIAYNHIDYIGQALASAQMQQGVEIEIIAHDDFSTDGTREFILDAAARDPRITPVISGRNLASNAVVRRALEKARGKYVCVLDADDYWTVEDRLARQVAILDANPSLSGCFHNAWAIKPNSDGPASLWTAPDQSRLTCRETIWHGNPFATATGMLRRDALRDVREDWYDSFFLTDWPLYSAASMHGDLLFVNEPVAAYRLHDASSFAARAFEERLKRISEFYLNTARGLAPYMPQAEMLRGAGFYFGDLARHYAEQGDIRKSLACLWHSAFTGSVRQSIGWRAWARVLRSVMNPDAAA